MFLLSGRASNPIRVGFPFAKLLRNICGTKRKIFLSLRISFARKNNNLRNHSQKSFRAKLPYSAFAQLEFCAIPQLDYCAIPQFRKNPTCDGVYFLEFNFGKILFWNLPIGHFYIIDQWQSRRVQISRAHCTLFIRAEGGQHSVPIRNEYSSVLEGFVPKSVTDCPVKVSTILVLGMLIS